MAVYAIDSRKTRAACPLKRLNQGPEALVSQFVLGDIARKTAMCVDVLDQAQTHSRTGQCGPSFERLIARARRLLDGIDRRLAALGRKSNPRPFARAKSLRRDLAQTLAAIATVQSPGYRKNGTQQPVVRQRAPALQRRSI